MTESFRGTTLRAVGAALDDAVRLLNSYSGPLTGAGPGPRGRAVEDEVAALSPARARIRTSERRAALAGVSRSAFYTNVTRLADEIDNTFAMLSDESSRQTLETVIKLRLLLAVYPPAIVNAALGGLPARWEEEWARAETMTGVINGLMPSGDYWVGVYSLPGLCSIEPGDVVLDVGARDSALHFRSLCGPHGHVHAFELDPRNHARLVAELGFYEVNNVTAVCQGLWETVGRLPVVIQPGGSYLSPGQAEKAGENNRIVNTIDNYCMEADLARLDFIKIGAVWGAIKPILIGATQAIARYRPRIAVTTYFREGQDYAEIPRLLREYVKGPYKFYLRHYSQAHRSTVMYAAPHSL